jgi:hypothetical protein
MKQSRGPHEHIRSHKTLMKKEKLHKPASSGAACSDSVSQGDVTTSTNCVRADVSTVWWRRDGVGLGWNQTVSLLLAACGTRPSHSTVWHPGLRSKITSCWVGLQLFARCKGGRSLHLAPPVLEDPCATPSSKVGSPNINGLVRSFHLFDNNNNVV